MPRLDVPIETVWTHHTQPDRIFYTVRRANGDRRKMYAKSDSALFGVLREHLDAVGYDGPRKKMTAETP